MRPLTFKVLFLEQLLDLCATEKQSLNGLRSLAEVVEDEKLNEVIQNHVKETEKQSHRLQKMFDILEEKIVERTCKGVDGLQREVEALIKEYKRSSLRDAALIAMAQKIEHYEIAAYEATHSFAIELELQEIADLLQESLDEELNMDKALTKLAQGGIFRKGINTEAQTDHPGGR